MLVRSPYSNCISLLEGAVLLPGTIVACLDMLALISMVGMASRAAPPKRSAAWSEERPISPSERSRWRVGWVLSTLPILGLAVTDWRYMKGGDVSVPASAPLIDHIIWILTVVGIIGEFAVICLYVTRQVRQDRSRPEDSTGA